MPVFTEELTLIRNAENDADRQKKNARVEAAGITEKAYSEATNIVDAAEKSAKEKYDILLAEGEKTADEQYKQAIEEAKAKADEIAEKALSNMNEAVCYIVERIVENSVNS